MYVFPFKTPGLRELDNLFGKCGCNDCIKKDTFTLDPDYQKIINTGLPVAELYDYTSIERNVPLPWNLPSRYDT